MSFVDTWEENIPDKGRNKCEDLGQEYTWSIKGISRRPVWLEERDILYRESQSSYILGTLRSK